MLCVRETAAATKYRIYACLHSEPMEQRFSSDTTASKIRSFWMNEAGKQLRSNKDFPLKEKFFCLVDE